GAEYDSLAVRPPGKALHVLVVMGEGAGFSPGGRDGVNVEVEDVTALEGEPAIVRRPAEAGIQGAGRQGREDARITAVTTGHGELYFVIGRGAEIRQVFAIVTDVAGCDCAYQPACRAAERRNFKDSALALRVEQRGEVNERSGIRRPAGLQVGRGIAGDLQWRAASSRTQMCGTSLPPESATDLPSGEIAGDSSTPTKSVSRLKEIGAPALGAAALREVRYAAPATATSSSAASGQTRFHLADVTAGGAIAEVEDAAEIPSRAKATSRMEWKRSSRSFSRQWSTMRSKAGGTLRPLSESVGGCSFRMALMVSAEVARSNARTPESISYRMAPKLKMSVRWSVGMPRACS